MQKKYVFILIGLLVIGGGLYIFLQNEPEPYSIEPHPNETEEAELVDEPEATVKKAEESPDENTEENAADTDRPSFIQSALNFLTNTQTVNITAIGDSLTQGVGDETDGGGYVGILQRSMNQDEKVANFDEYGKRGNRTDQLLKRIEEKPEIQQSLKKADIIIMTIGANDIMKVAKENMTNIAYEAFEDERPRFERRLADVFKTIRDYNDEAHIYLVGFYNPFQKYFPDIEELDRIAETWNDTSADMTLEDGNSTFIPTADLFSEATTDIFAEDNFHPNYDGYYLMAERVLSYLSNR